MRAWIDEGFGNPSGSHQIARRARAAVEDARDAVASFMGVDAGGVVFTSGGTEADNLAVLGTVFAGRPGAVVISAVEHPAVVEAAIASGREVRMAAVDAHGVIDLDQLRLVVDRDVAVVSVQLANHETGVMQPLPAIAARLRKWAPDAVIHTDAVQGAAWVDLVETTSCVDLVSISGHKIGGPQGSGALAIRNSTRVAPIIQGGGQEAERRSGTQNVVGIAGLGAAVGAVSRSRDQWAEKVRTLRDRLAALILDAVPDTVWTAERSPLAPGHLHLRFGGVESEALLFLLDEAGVCASAGAACASGAIEPSPVLLAMGIDKSDAGSALRLTLGPTTTGSEVDQAAAAVSKSVATLRG